MPGSVEPAIRPAAAADVGAVPLIYQAGPEAFDYSFGIGRHTAHDFLTAAFPRGHGFVGYRIHFVAVINDRVVGAAAFYGGDDYRRLVLGTGVQILRYYGRDAWQAIVRGLKTTQLMPAPGRSVAYVADFCVAQEWRGRGIGSALLGDAVTRARRQGRRTLALDVAVTNPRAQALYERFGMRVTGQQSFPVQDSGVPDFLRMELSLTSLR